VGRAGPEVIAPLNCGLLGKLADDRLLRARKLRVDTTVVEADEADIDDPTDADLPDLPDLLEQAEQAVRKLGGLVRRIKTRGVAGRTRSGIVVVRLGGGWAAGGGTWPHAAPADRGGDGGGGGGGPADW
jgi:hypothetical protein